MSEAFAEYLTGIDRVEFPYNQELVEQIKEGITPPNRAWNAKDKVWEFSSEAWAQARDIIEGFYSVVD